LDNRLPRLRIEGPVHDRQRAAEISRSEHEAILETVQARLDRNPGKMRIRRQETLKHVSTEMALHVLSSAASVGPGA
jgi:hypothetical protein